MQGETVEQVDAWWAELFGIDRDALWRSTTVRAHGRLGAYAGLFVAWRAHGVHVSAPPEWIGGVEETLVPQGIPALQHMGPWAQWTSSRSLRVIGPSTHSYLDVDPGPSAGVVRIDDDALPHPAGDQALIALPLMVVGFQLGRVAS